MDVGKVDLVAQEASGSVALFIIHEAPWTGDRQEALTLNQKFHHYVGYASDGQLVREHPSLSGQPVRIVLKCRTPLPPDVAAVVDHMQTALPKYNIGLEIKPLTQGDAGGVSPSPERRGLLGRVFGRG